jgi:siroheme decarboxylase
MLNLDEQNQLAKNIQKGFPLHTRPFQVLADQLSVKETDVLDQMKEWKASGMLREISAVLEGDTLGYESGLVAGKVEIERLDEVQKEIAKHPTVTHLYERNHEYNLWFTIAAPSSIGIDNYIQKIRKLTNVDNYYILRRTDTFKIGVVFDLESKQNSTEKTDLSLNIEPLHIDDRTIHLIRTVQTDLPLTERPFLEYGKKYHLQEEEILAFLNDNKGKSVRKFVATFQHRKLGVSYNSMSVWNVPKDSLTKIGNLIAGENGVSHCYSRNTFPGFPYNLYAMLHGPDKQTVDSIIKNLSEQTGITEYLSLNSTREFKKTRLRYFLEELENWERYAN